MSFLYIKVYYGPCDTFGTYMHKPQLLTGLRNHLMKLGFRVDIVPVEIENLCLLEMCGYEIFRCNIKNLKFNTVVKRDRVCQRAVQAVMSSAIKLREARACLWLWTLLDSEIFKRSPYAPKDHWLVDIDWTILTSCKECIKCCNMLVQKRDDVGDNLEHNYSTLF